MLLALVQFIPRTHLALFFVVESWTAIVTPVGLFNSMLGAFVDYSPPFNNRNSGGLVDRYPRLERCQTSNNSNIVFLSMS